MIHVKYYARHDFPKSHIVVGCSPNPIIRDRWSIEVLKASMYDVVDVCIAGLGTVRLYHNGFHIITVRLCDLLHGWSLICPGGPSHSLSCPIVGTETGWKTLPRNWKGLRENRVTGVFHFNFFGNSSLVCEVRVEESCVLLLWSQLRIIFPSKKPTTIEIQYFTFVPIDIRWRVRVRFHQSGHVNWWSWSGRWSGGLALGLGHLAEATCIWRAAHHLCDFGSSCITQTWVMWVTSLSYLGDDMIVIALLYAWKGDP